MTAASLSDITMSRVAVLGCGSMGSALIRGLLRAPHPPQILAFDPQAEAARTRLGESAAVVTDNLADVVAFRPDLLILALKPQLIRAAAADFANLSRGRWVLSIAAGLGTDELRDLVPQARGLIRAMPNLAMMHGSGMTVFVVRPHDDDAGLRAIETLFGASGRTARVRSDADLDIATAISGSGLAYFFAMVQALAGAGERMGLDRGLARQLAAQTLAGAGALADDFETVEMLKRAVQSPGGTTAAALSALEGPQGIGPVVEGAVAAAVNRARELAR